MSFLRSRFMVLILLLLAAAVVGLAWQESVVRRTSRVQENVLRNLYIITASGLRPDHLSSYLYDHSQTPGIDFLAYDGIRFLNAFTTSPESMRAHLSLLTGLYSFRPPVSRMIDSLSARGDTELPAGLNSIPDWFQRRGYRSVCYLADQQLQYPNFFLRMFSEVYTQDISPAQESRLACDWILKHHNEPQFVLLNFGEPSSPYQPPPPYNKHYQNHPYDGEVVAVDDQIGFLVNLLKRSGLFQKSIIVFTAPYAESLDEQEQEASLHDSILHIPLLIAAPGLLPRHKEYQTQVSLVDIFPTILSLTESKSAENFDGLALFRKGSEEEITRSFIFGETRATYPRYFIRSIRAKYVTGEKKNSSLQPRLEKFMKDAGVSLTTETPRH